MRSPRHTKTSLPTAASASASVDPWTSLTMWTRTTPASHAASDFMTAQPLRPIVPNRVASARVLSYGGRMKTEFSPPRCRTNSYHRKPRRSHPRECGQVPRPRGHVGPAGRGLGRHHGEPVPRRGAGRRQGNHRERRRARRADRDHVPHALRVDAGRLRHLVRGHGQCPRLRDVQRRAGPVDPQRLRRGGGVPRESQEQGGLRSRCGRRAVRHPGMGLRRRDPRRAQGRRGEHLGRDARGAACHPRPGHARDDHLHIRHDGSAQGLHAHPPQLHVRGRQRGQRPPGRLPGAGLVDPAVPSDRPRLRAGDPARLRSGGRAPRALRRHEAVHAWSAVLPADLPARRAPPVRADLQRLAAEGPGRGQGQDLRHGRAGGHRLQHVTRQRRPGARSCASSTPSSTGSSTASCARRWAGR